MLFAGVRTAVEQDTTGDVITVKHTEGEREPRYKNVHKANESVLGTRKNPCGSDFAKSASIIVVSLRQKASRIQRVADSVHFSEPTLWMQ